MIKENKKQNCSGLNEQQKKMIANYPAINANVGDNTRDDSFKEIFVKCLNRLSIGDNTKTYQIPDSVGLINTSAFINCANLNTIKASNESIELASNSFIGPSELNPIEFTNPVVVTTGSFQSSNFTEIKFQDKLVLKYGSADRLFAECKKLKRVNIPNNIEAIEYKWFKNTTSLESIELPSNLRYIDDYAFSSSGIEELEFPKSLCTIGENAFEYSNLKSANLKECNINVIGSNAFLNCINLNDVKLPNSCESVAVEIFKFCKNLTSIECSKDTEWQFTEYNGVVIKVSGDDLIAKLKKITGSNNVTVSYY